MGMYYYLNDPKAEFGTTTVSDDDYVAAIFRIVKKNGVEIIDKMILNEIKRI